MRPTPAGFFAARLMHRALSFAFLLGTQVTAQASAPSNELGRPLSRNFPPGRSKIAHLCQAVTQDAVGFIYIANGNQIRRYDGATWKLIPLPNESAGVRKFAVAANGTVYAGGASVLGYLLPAGANHDYVSLIDQLAPADRNFDDIYDVLAVGNAVYFATEEKILIWRDRHFTVVPCPTPPHSRGARLHRVGEAVYVTSLDHPLCRLTHDRLEVVADDRLLRQNQIVSVEAGAAGTLVLLTAGQGFFQLTAGRITPWPIDANRWLAGKTIFRAQRLGDGSLVVAFTSVSGDGGMRFAADGYYVGALDQSIGFYVKTLRDFFCDREGGLWIGTETGVFRLEWPSAVTVFDVINGLGQGVVADVARHNGALYAATAEGVFRLVPSDDRDGSAAHFERIFGAPAFSLVSHPRGLLVLGYADLFAQSPGGFTSVATIPPGSGLLHRSRRDPDRVWISTAHGIQSVRHTPQGWRDEGLVAGFDENARELAEAADGALWAATFDHGLFRLEFGDGDRVTRGAPRIERFTGSHGFPEQFQRVSTAIWAGDPVIVTNSTARPLRFDVASHRFVPVVGTESLPADATDDGWLPSDNNAESEADALWLASPTSIYQVPRQGLPRRLPRLVKEAAGKVSQMREETSAAGTVLWICGSNCLVRVDVAHAFPSAAPFMTLLTTADVHEGDRLAAGRTALKFDYVALRHQLADSVAYQTRLVGYDRDWSSWSAERERAFTGLSAGGYQFDVRARDADGQITAPTALAFTILPLWWQTPWVYFGDTIVGIILIGSVVWFRTRALHRRAARLELVVAERTAELAQKNTELVRLNRLEFDEKVSARLAEEKARLEVLRYQLNPHFLFNTLASISASLPAGRSTARAMVERLAEFCRLTLHRADDREWTTLCEEMRLLRAYLEIEQSRWGDLLDIAIDCPPGLDSERLPHFLLLPLVENALKYGRATSPDRVGLRLAARREPDGTLVLEVANTGEWVDPAAKKTVASLGIGLDNLRERLARYYPRAHQLAISHTGGWVKVVLRLLNSPAV